jgi:hypothetical protein
MGNQTSVWRNHVIWQGTKCPAQPNEFFQDSLMRAHLLNGRQAMINLEWNLKLLIATVIPCESTRFWPLQTDNLSLLAFLSPLIAHLTLMTIGILMITFT